MWSQVIEVGFTWFFSFASFRIVLQTADTRAADEQTIRDLDAQGSKTAGTNDVDGTVAIATTPFCCLRTAPFRTNKKAIRASWASVLGPGVALSWKAEKIDVSSSGDLVYVVGSYSDTYKDAQGKTLTDQGKTLTDQGKLVEVWKKQADGKWKAVPTFTTRTFPAGSLEKL